MTRRLILAGFMCAAAGGAARASEMGGPPGPLLAPTRDVTVDYILQPGRGDTLPIEVEIAAGGARLRVTSTALPTALLVDRRAETAAVVLPMLRAYTILDIGKYDLQATLLRRATFTRGGQARVAGRPCTEWHARAPDGDAEACITWDGVILKGHATSARRGDAGAIEATRVVYGALPPQDFDVPPGFYKSGIPLTAHGFGQ